MMRKELCGLSVQDVESSKHKYSETFAMGADACRTKTLAVLKDSEAIVVKEENKGLFILAIKFGKVCASCINTTQVAILITSQGPEKCGVEIYSENYNLSEAFSTELFKKLEPKAS